MHPTLDRLLHWKRLNGGFEDEHWDDNTYVHRDDGVCWGHQQHDALLWSNLFGEDADADSATGHHYTNGELYALTDPQSHDSLPYVYDNFEWDHCDAQGVSLRGLFDL